MVLSLGFKFAFHDCRSVEQVAFDLPVTGKIQKVRMDADELEDVNIRTS